MSEGQCIYCGIDWSRSKLTDEHVVPFALNGQMVLKKASCLPCAAITGSIEQKILRGMLLEARTHLRMKTRRPKARPESFPVRILDGTSDTTQFLPISQNPLFIGLPVLDKAPILNGVTGSEYIGHVYPYMWNFFGVNNQNQSYVANNSDKYKKFSEYDTRNFGLFLAKVGHCATMYSNGFVGYQPLLNDLIIRKSDLVWDYVGGCPNPMVEHRDASFFVNVRQTSEWTIAEMSIFPHLGAPFYQVVTGRKFLIDNEIDGTLG